MKGVLWGKLLLNLNNALNALAGVPLAAELADRRWRRLLAAQIGEALAVLKAAGIRPARIEGVPPARDPAHPAAARLAVPAGRAPHAGDRPGGALIDVGGPGAAAGDRDRLSCRGRSWRWPQRRVCAVPLTERIVRLVKEAEAARAGSPGLTPEQVGRMGAAVTAA